MQPRQLACFTVIFSSSWFPNRFNLHCSGADYKLQARIHPWQSILSTNDGSCQRIISICNEKRIIVLAQRQSMHQCGPSLRSLQINLMPAFLHVLHLNRTEIEQRNRMMNHSDISQNGVSISYDMLVAKRILHKKLKNISK